MEQHPVPRLSVPLSHREALSWLASARDDQVSAIAGVLAKPISISRSNYARAIYDSAEIHLDVAQELLDAVLALDMTMQHHAWNAGDVAAGVARSADLEIATGDEPQLARRLEELLVASAVRPLAKATTLARAHPRMYHTSKVVVDVRPVFRENVTEAPIAALLSPILHLEFWNEEGSLESTSLSLDLVDVADLAEACSRALAKAKTLETMMEKADLQLADASELGYDI